MGLHLTLMGRFGVTLGGIESPLASTPARLILAYLALSSGHRSDRGALAAMIWESSEPARARQNLRQTLHELGRLLGPGVLIADRASVGLVPDGLSADVLQTLEVVAHGAVPDGLTSGALHPDRLLADLPIRGEMLTSWLRFKRSEYEDRLRDGLNTLLEQPQAAPAAAALMALDPCNEQAVRYLMRASHRAGQTGRALDLYDQLWARLERDYDVEPSLETQALIARIKLGEAPQAAPQPVVSNRLRIGLAPIEASGSDTATGIARLFRIELLATLLRFRGFEIVDQSFSHDTVDTVLDVSVVAQGGTLTLFSVLTRCHDGVVLWSEHWRGLTDNWMSTQAALIAKLGASLSLHISQARLHELSHDRLGTRAFDHWLMGNTQLDSFRPASAQSAAAQFHEVIRLAPNASMGYSSLARLNNGLHLMVPGRMRERKTHLEAKQAASKAVSLDPLDSRAHLHRGWACCLLREYDQAAAGFDMARSCNPNDPWTVLSSALGAAFSDDVPLARGLSQTVIDQGWTIHAFQWGFHAPIRFLGGDDAGCVAAAEAGQGAILNIPAWQAAALWHLGEHAAARDAWARFEDLCQDALGPGNNLDRDVLCRWFLSCFPIRDPAQMHRLSQGAAGAAGLQVHCVQQ
ncbi:MAG: BTAD domain-containing putative transcriptional regulator [Sedimentitalea sp.]